MIVDSFLLAGFWNNSICLLLLSRLGILICAILAGYNGVHNKTGFDTVPENAPFSEVVREALPDGPVQHGLKSITNLHYEGNMIPSAMIITSVEPEPKSEKPKRKTRAVEPVTA